MMCCVIYEGIEESSFYLWLRKYSAEDNTEVLDSTN